jgi:hypothetical protein
MISLFPCPIHVSVCVHVHGHGHGHRDMDVDILSAIVGGELQQHESQGLSGWLCLQYVTICSLYTFLL